MERGPGEGHPRVLSGTPAVLPLSRARRNFLATRKRVYSGNHSQSIRSNILSRLAETNVSALMMCEDGSRDRLWRAILGEEGQQKRHREEGWSLCNLPCAKAKGDRRI